MLQCVCVCVCVCVCECVFTQTNPIVHHRYEAPNFVVNALQQSNLECTWDQDADKERKLTNVSLWRKLKEDDLMQYIASSDSSDNDEGSGGEEQDSEDEGTKKKQSSK
jgi:hypothetical protein